LAGLDEQQLQAILKQERMAEVRTVKGTYQPLEGMNRTHRKEFIERLLIQHKRRQLDDHMTMDTPGDSLLDFSASIQRSQTATHTNILARRKKQ